MLRRRTETGDFLWDLRYEFFFSSAQQLDENRFQGVHHISPLILLYSFLDSSHNRRLRTVCGAVRNHDADQPL